MITKDKVSEILYIIDEFECQTFKKTVSATPCNNGIRHRNSNGCMAESEIITFLHFKPYHNLSTKHKEWLWRGILT